jgi:hypothetical protein
MPIGDCILRHGFMPSSGQASRFQRNAGGANVQHGGRITSTLLIASLMLGVSSAAVLARDDNPEKSKAEQASKKKSSTEETAKKSTAERDKKSAADRDAKPSAEREARSSGDEPKNRSLVRKLEAMERRMQSLEMELNQKEARASMKAPASGDLFGGAPAPAPGLKIGMYGEIKFGSVQNPAANGQWQSGFDLGRVVLLPTYQVTDNIVFNAEIEFEHAGIAFAADDKLNGTVEIEQAFFDIRFNDHFILRSPGVDLVPIAFNNLYHEPTLFYSVERPELANGLIPTTWWAPSAGFYGKIVDGLNYQFQVSQSAEDFGDDFAHRGDNHAPTPGGYAAGVNGADALALTRAPLGDFNQISNQPAFAFRLSYQPSFIPGFAGSTAVYYSPDITPRGAYSDELLDDGTNRPLGKNAMTIFDTEARYRVPNTGLELRAEYAYVNFSNPENLRANNDSIIENNVGKDMYGYSGEIAYHVPLGNILGSDWEAVPFYRYTRQNLQTGGIFGIDPNGSNGSGDMTFHDIGVAVFPNPSLVFKLNYTKAIDHSATGPMSDKVLGSVGWLW